MVQSGGCLGRFLGPLLKTGLLLIKNIVKSLAKSVLISLGLTAEASAADAGIHKKSKPTTLIISNNKMKDIKIVKSPEDSGLLPEGVNKTFQNEAKELKKWISQYVTWYSGCSLLGNILEGKGINTAGEGAIARSVSEEAKSKRQDQGIVRLGCGNKKG